MCVWRIGSSRYDPLDGEGARRVGGRWNSPGRPVVYAAASAALAVLEKLVWVDVEDVPNDLLLFEIAVPDEVCVEHIAPKALPSRWTEPGSPACAEIGDAWLARGTSVALTVPSAVLPEERNVLLNPAHAAATRLRVAEQRPFRFDLRLL